MAASRVTLRCGIPCKAQGVPKQLVLERGLHPAGTAVGVGATQIPKPGKTADTALERAAQPHADVMAQAAEQAGKSVARGVE